MITLYVTLAVTLANEQVPKGQEVEHGATTKLDAGKTPCWAGATPLFATGSWPKDHRGRSSPTNRTSRQHVSLDGPGFERSVFSRRAGRTSSFSSSFSTIEIEVKSSSPLYFSGDFTNHFTGGAPAWLGKSIRCTLLRGPSCMQTGTTGGRERPHPLTHRASRTSWVAPALVGTSRHRVLRGDVGQPLEFVRQAV
jgi:hypothetical protein